jgi:hypothetical protein
MPVPSELVPLPLRRLNPIPTPRLVLKSWIVDVRVHVHGQVGPGWHAGRGLEWSRVSSTDGRLLDVVVVVGGRSRAGATPETEVVPVAPLSAGLVMLRPLRALSELDDLCRRAEVGVGI